MARTSAASPCRGARRSFTVTPDPRPFVVQAAKATLNTQAAQFNLQLNRSRVMQAVADKAVSLRLPGQSDLRIAGGWQSAYDSGHVLPPVPTPAQDIGA